MSERNLDLVFENIDIWYADTGIYMHHTCGPYDGCDIEGIRIYNPVLYGVGMGIHWTTPNAGEPDLQIFGGHINAESYGICCSHANEVFVNGTSIYKQYTPSTVTAFFGIDIQSNCLSATITNCRIVNLHAEPTPPQLDRAIYVAGQKCTIIGNNIKTFDQGIALTTQSQYCTVVGNIIADTTEEIDNDGANNWIDGSNVFVP